MPNNPYEPPQTLGEANGAESNERKKARRSLRVTAIILFLPAAYNYWAFDTRVMARFPGDLATAYRTVNIVGLVVLALLIWFIGLTVLEAIARLLRNILAPATDRAAWEVVLYRSLSRTIYLAIPGAALWAIWVFCFYQTELDFYTISWAIGVPAHVLAACWYVPLMYRWFRLARSRSASW